MHKQDLSDALSRRFEGRNDRLDALTKIELMEIIEATLDAMTEALAAGETVKLVGFGKFEIVKNTARTGRNPSTGEMLDIPALNRVAFRIGKGLKGAVNA